MRPISAFALKGISKVAVNAFREFTPADAVRLLANYGGIRSSTDDPFELRSGRRIQVASPLDVATVAVIFLRRDYGIVERGSVVLDVGANVGFFSLWAAVNGARRVVAMEPEPGNFARLVDALDDYIRQGVVQPLELGVAARTAERSLVLRESPTHSLYAGSSVESGNSISVRCQSLDEVLANNELESLDLLKMDIEGGEYEAFYGASPETLRRIRQIRLEYHNLDDEPENGAALRSYLVGKGFAVTRHAAISPASGMLWLSQQGSESGLHPGSQLE